MAAKPAKAKASPPPPDVEVHDEVYFHHKGTVLSGKVLAHGKRGAHVQVEGAAEPHRVKWEHMAGHKMRSRPSMKVVDQGEDGLILEGQDGRRRYVHDPIYETTMMKALKGGAGLSLQPVTDKAGHATQRWKKTSPDEKKGRPAAKAKPAAAAHTPAKVPPPAGPGYGKHNVGAGTVVHFKAGDFEGKGEVVGEPGEHGAHVKDSSGRQHKVLWSEVSGHEVPKTGEAKARAKETAEKGKAPPPPEPPDYPDRQEGESDKKWLKRIAPNLAPPESLPEEHAKYFNMGGSTVIPLDKLKSSKSDEENEQGGGNAPKFMLAAYHGKVARRDPIKVTPNADGTFTVLDGNGTYTGVKAHGWKELPALIAQPHETKEEIYEAAAAGVDHLYEWLNKGSGVCSKAGMRTMDTGPGKLTPEDWQKPGGMLFVGNIKGEARAEEKVNSDYGGDWSRLLDVARCTIAVDTMDDVTGILDKLHASGMVVARAKNRFAEPTELGYRDMALAVRFPNGHVGEVQVNVKSMMRVKSEGHKHYEAVRSLAAKHGTASPEDWPPEDEKAYAEAMKAQLTLYGQAWADAGGAK